MPRLSRSQVARAMAAYLGTPVNGVEPLAGSVANQDFMIHTEGGDLILKAGPAGELRAEAYACVRVKEAGIPVPDIEALELDRQILPEPFILIRRLPGAALPALPAPAAQSDTPVAEFGTAEPGLAEGAVVEKVLVEAGRRLRMVHELTGDGYGFLAHTRAPATPAGAEPPTADPQAAVPTRLTGPDADWTAVTTQPLGFLADLTEHQVIGEHLGARIQDALKEYAGAVAYDRTGVLLHGDLKLAHVFADRGRLTGIIDWGDAAYGDPLYDLARFSLCGRRELEALLAGYDLSLSAELEITFAVYRVIRNTTGLYYEHRAGGDWFATYRSWIEDSLRTLT